ncbi:MAG: ATP-binding protein [Bacteroidota bacterium]|nr:ATP-binding protein [Bacteroidota bacterium]
MEYRFLYEEVKSHLTVKKYTIITGARQVGKTTILRQLHAHLRSRNEKSVLINLEDKNVLESLNNDVKSIFKFIPFHPQRIIDGKTNRRIFFLIDEIQYLDDPSNFMKYLYDEYEYNVKLIVTGSSAFYIDKKFKDSLAGRKRIFHLYPLSFEEFLIFKKQDKISDEIGSMVQEPSYHSQYKISARGYLMEYLMYGGYPDVVLEDNKREKKWILDELKNSYLRRDIIEAGVDKEIKFLNLLQILADQTGNLVNKNELGNTLQIDNKTADTYVYILQKCFHIDLLKPYHRNIRKEITKMPKVYFNDLGLRNSILGRFDPPRQRADKGALIENFVYNQLRIKYSPEKIKHWRTSAGHEVDFVVEETYNTGLAIEVKWNCKKFNQKKYKKFISTYPEYPLTCIDADNIEMLNR